MQTSCLSSRMNSSEMLDENFDHLLLNFSKPNYRESAFGKNCSENDFLGLDHGNYRLWLLDNLLPNTRLIIEPKIKGSPVLLEYANGILARAINQDGMEKTSQISFIENVPKIIPIVRNLRIRGEIYAQGFSAIKSRRLTKKHLAEYFPNGKGIRFSSFQILNTDLNHYSQLKELDKLGFEIPPNECTRIIANEVEIYRQLWKAKKLFSEFPTDGIVLKVNSRKCQKQLGQSLYSCNWAYAIKD